MDIAYFFLNSFVLILKCCCVHAYAGVFICELYIYIAYTYNFTCTLIPYNIFALESYWLLIISYMGS